MILVSREVGSKELLPLIRRIGVPAELDGLAFGDSCFQGNGPQGSVLVGIERKSLHDILACVDDHRFSAHQMPGMKQMYDVCILIVEGMWRPHDPDLSLMEGFQGGASWGYCRYRSQKTLYAKLRRYLLSVSLAGFIVIYTRDMWHTAVDITDAYHYFNKPWSGHTSLIEKQKLHIPDLNGKPSLIRRWAMELDGVGVKKVDDVQHLFKNAFTMASADESEWLKIPRVGLKTAQDIVKEIRGWK